MMTLVSFQHYDYRMLQRDATPPCGVLMSMLSTQLHRRLSKVSKAAARGLQDMIVKNPPCGVGNVKLVYFHSFFFLVDIGAAMAASRTRFRHTPCRS